MDLPFSHTVTVVTAQHLAHVGAAPLSILLWWIQNFASRNHEFACSSNCHETTIDNCWKLAGT
jgi:hypothetical protein